MYFGFINSMFSEKLQKKIPISKEMGFFLKV